MRAIRVVIGSAILVTRAGSAFSQALNPSSQQTSQAASGAIQLYTVPESPAFTFLDITPAKITKPTTARDFVTGLINAIDDKGHVRQGLAFEVAGSVISGHPSTLSEYQQRWNPRTIFNRAQVSLATVRAAGDTASTDAGYGIRIPILDYGDPMADNAFTTRLIAAFQKCPRPAPSLPTSEVSTSPNPAGTIADSAARRLVSELLEKQKKLAAEQESAAQAAAIAEQKACNGKAVETLAKEYGEEHWNAANLSIAYAGGHRLVSALAEDTRELGNRVWAVGGVPIFGSVGQLLGLLQYANLVPAPDSAHETSLRYGVRSTWGRPTFNGFLELFREKRTPKGLPSVQRDGWSGGLEFRVASDLWLAAGFGRATELKGSPAIVIANLKWALNGQSQFGR